MHDLYNLIVDLDGDFDAEVGPDAGLVVERVDARDEALEAWIDAEFGGCWSAEARAGACVVAWRDGLPVGFAAYDARGLRFRWLRGVAREPGVGLFGPIGVIEAERGRGTGRRLLQATLSELRQRGYARALIGAVGESVRGFYASVCDARVAERFDRRRLLLPRVRAVLMASGSGSNVQAVLDAVDRGELPLEVAAVACNVEGAGVLGRAEVAGVPTRVLPWRRSDISRSEYDAELLRVVDALRPELVLLLGWMHLLDAAFVRAFPALLNVHPAFLPLDPLRDEVTFPDGSVTPAFRGAHAVRDALAWGSGWIGATVHGVTAQTDRGPVLARKPMRVRAGDDAAAALARLHPIEHELVAGGVKRWLYERP